MSPRPKRSSGWSAVMPPPGRPPRGAGATRAPRRRCRSRPRPPSRRSAGRRRAARPARDGARARRSGSQPAHPESGRPRRNSSAYSRIIAAASSRPGPSWPRAPPARAPHHLEERLRPSAGRVCHTARARPGPRSTSVRRPGGHVERLAGAHGVLMPPIRVEPPSSTSKAPPGRGGGAPEAPPPAAQLDSTSSSSPPVSAAVRRNVRSGP